MFQSIKRILDYAGASPFGSPMSSYQVIDTDFEGDIYSVDDTDCVFIRIIIHEYSKRQLNVAANLKLYYNTYFNYISFNHSYKDAVSRLATHRSVLNAYYSHLFFDNYYPCLQRHLKRMAFVGKLK